MSTWRIFFFFVINLAIHFSLSPQTPWIPTSDAISHALHLIPQLILHEDTRLAYLYIKSILAHPNSSFTQRYTAIQLLAHASNCSRHVDIEKRTLVDILRNDHEMEYQVNLLLFPDNIQDYRGLSYESYISRYFQSNRLEDILTLSHAYASQYETLPITELPTLFQSYGIYYGRNAEFNESKKYLELCILITQQLEYESYSCNHMLQYTEIQIKNGLLAILQEFSHRVLASRTISAARNNYEIITKIINILRNIPSPTSSTSTTLKTIIQSALITLFECKKYLYYHGWLTQYEFLSTMKSVMSQSHLESDVYMIDTQKLALQDLNFANWRHNGSEYQYWLQRKSSHQMDISSEADPHRPYILRFITNGMSAHNFGHANHDILWPFIASYNLYHLFPRQTAPIYVIDIGIFIIKFLQIAYPQRTFIGFRSMSMVPFNAEEIFISGLGAPKYYDLNTIRKEEMKEVRLHMTRRCTEEFLKKTISAAEISHGTTPPPPLRDPPPPTTTSTNPDTLKIIFIERNLTKKFKIDNDFRYEQDYQEDHPALRHYYDSGYWSHTVLTSKRVLGSQRRNILNFESLFHEFSLQFPVLYHSYSKKFPVPTDHSRSSSLLHRKHIEIIRLNPEDYDYCEQVLYISNANVVIGQHGAAMSLIGYMKPEESLVIELESILNQIFQFISQGTGIKYRGVLMNDHEGTIYLTKDKHHITVNSTGLAQLVLESLLL